MNKETTFEERWGKPSELRRKIADIILDDQPPELAKMEINEILSLISTEREEAYKKGVSDELECIEKFPQDHPQLLKVYGEVALKEFKGKELDEFMDGIQIDESYKESNNE